MNRKNIDLWCWSRVFFVIGIMFSLLSAILSNYSLEWFNWVAMVLVVFIMGFSGMLVGFVFVVDNEVREVKYEGTA